MSGPCESCGGAWGDSVPVCPACGGKELSACQKCGGYGGKIITFKYPTRRTESRWVCPWCIDRDRNELEELKQQARAFKELQKSNNEFMGEWT